MFGELVPVGGGDNIPLKKQELVVGRKEDCDIVLRFSNVSANHCKLILSNGYWYVQDMRSTNGVRVNGVKVEDRRIDPGSKLMISKQEFTLEYDPNELGAYGSVPPDVLDGDVFSKSLMERAGLQSRRSSNTYTTEEKKKPEPKKNTIEQIDYSMFSVDDIHFE